MKDAKRKMCIRDSFRGSPVLPWDLMSVGTAMSVSDNYEFSVEYPMLIVALGFALLMAVASKISIRLPKALIHWKAKDIFSVSYTHLDVYKRQ